MNDLRGLPTRPVTMAVGTLFALILVISTTGCGDGGAKAAQCYQTYTACVAACDAALDAARTTWRQCKEDSKAQLAADLAACRERPRSQRADCIRDAYSADAQRKEACGQALDAAVQANADCRAACGDAYNACVGN